VARDEDIEGQMGKDIYFDLVDHDKVRSFRVQKQTPFNVFKVSPSIILVLNGLVLIIFYWTNCDTGLTIFSLNHEI
jgi:hypothetical protein